MMDDAKLDILERFGDSDVQNLVAEIRKLRAVEDKNIIMHVALTEIFHASRDDGLAAMCNWMRGRAAAALAEVHHHG